MAGAFLYANTVGAAAGLASPNPVPAGMPLANLLTVQPRMRARLGVPFTDSSGGLALYDVTTAAGLGLALDPARTNYVPSSQIMDDGYINSPLGSSNRVFTANAAVAPDGTTTAYRIATNATAGANVYACGFLDIPLALAGRTVTFSVYAKADRGRTILLQAFGSSASPYGPYAPQVTFDLAAGTLNGSNGQIVPVGNGWYRCAVTWPQISDITYVSVAYLLPAASIPTSGDGVYVWGAQVEIGGLSAYIPTSGAIASRSATVPWGALRVDLGAATPLDCVALVSTSLSAAAKVRLRVSAADASATTGVLWDTGVVAAATAAELAGTVVLLRAAPVTGRYLLVEAYDPGATAVDIGRVVAGPLWRLARSHAYGIEEGRLMLDRRDRNAFTAAEFAAPAVANPRTARFTLPGLTPAEAAGQHRAMLAGLGAAGDALWIPDTGLAQAELNARSLWGAVAQPGAAGAARTALKVHGRSFTLAERL
jgi:hypothetical protein